MVGIVEFGAKGLHIIAIETVIEREPDGVLDKGDLIALANWRHERGRERIAHLDELDCQEIFGTDHVPLDLRALSVVQAACAPLTWNSVLASTWDGPMLGAFALSPRSGFFGPLIERIHASTLGEDPRLLERIKTWRKWSQPTQIALGSVLDKMDRAIKLLRRALGRTSGMTAQVQVGRKAIWTCAEPFCEAADLQSTLEVAVVVDIVSRLGRLGRDELEAFQSTGLVGLVDAATAKALRGGCPTDQAAGLRARWQELAGGSVQGESLEVFGISSAPSPGPAEA